MASRSSAQGCTGRILVEWGLNVADKEALPCWLPVTQYKVTAPKKKIKQKSTPTSEADASKGGDTQTFVEL